MSTLVLAFFFFYVNSVFQFSIVHNFLPFLAAGKIISTDLLGLKFLSVYPVNF